MKFKDMPYERVDFDKVEKEMKTLMEEFDAAGTSKDVDAALFRGAFRRLYRDASGGFRGVHPVRLHGGRVPAYHLRKSGLDSRRAIFHVAEAGEGIQVPSGLRR